MKAQALLSAAALLNITPVTSRSIQAHETPYIRSYFYAGGRYTTTPNGDEYLQGQIYVEKLTPLAPNEDAAPIVIIPGQGQTGTNFLNKPDGGEGWASLFLRHGHDVFILDQPFRGRSPWIPGIDLAPPFTVAATERSFTAISRFHDWPQAALHTQWPGNGSRGDPVFDAFYASQVHYTANETLQQLTTRDAGAALLEQFIGRPAIVLGHSQGSNMPLLIADARPDLVRAAVLVESTGPPFEEVAFPDPDARKWGLTEVPLRFEPAVEDSSEIVTERHPSEGEGLLGCTLQGGEQPRKLANLLDTPILLVTGEASYHAQYDYCTAQFLRQAGCSRTDHLELGKAGVHGNAHFMFLEKNSDDIHALIEDWIQKL